MQKIKLITLISLTLVSCTLLANQRNESTLHFVQKIHNNIHAFTTLLCEGIYSSRIMADNLTASKTPSGECYTLMLPIVEKYVQNTAKMKKKHLSQRQMDKIRDDIAHQATTSYLKQHISLARPIYLDNFRKDFPTTFCKRSVQNAILKPAMAHLTQSQCINYVKPLVDKCISRYSSNLPGQISYTDLHKFSYLIGSCCSIKFVNFFLNKQK